MKNLDSGFRQNNDETVLSPQSLLDILTHGLRDLGEDPAVHPCENYLWFLNELSKWNRTYNLTAIRDPERMVTHHLLDSLSILPYLHGDRCLDIGTGAGLPGLVLALARPATNWTLLDSRSKKIRFLQHVLLQLKPANIELVNSRVEDYRPAQPFSTIVSRAFGSLADFHRLAAPLRAKDGILLAMKGSLPEQELAELPGIQREVISLRVTGLNAERHLVVFGP